MMESIWSQTADRPHFPTQTGDIRTDVCIVGGGMCGILCAHLLHAAGMDYVLAEAAQICGGITRNTTAKLTYQHGLIYDRLMRTFGTEKAQMYLRANREALDRYRNLCRSIPCDYEEKPAYVYAQDNRRKLEKEALAYRKLGISADITETPSLPFPTVGALRVEKQAQFHPLKFAYTVAQGLHILENTRILAYKPGMLITDHGTISAKKIIIAAHFPFFNNHGLYFLKLYQHRSYVIALRHTPGVDGMYIDASKNGLSFRSCGDLLLVGGGGHRTGKNGGSWQALSDFAERYYPEAEEAARWAAQDCMSLDGIPYIGPYAKNTPDLFVASGFNKWGMTGSMAAALLLTDLVRGIENPYQALFSPSRSVLHPQLALNAAESVIGLLTPTVPRCPHLGCALKYNRQEHSWDCPCHGSRFTEDGDIID
ncbi:MAG: FAD-dependent oxidoreductase, partial [Eubacteriales bacterium]